MSAEVFMPAASAKTRPAQLRAKIVVSDEPGWKIMRSARGGGDTTWRQMLADNAALPPRLKHALEPETWGVELRAECLASENLLARSCAGFLRAESAIVAGDDAAETSFNAEEWIHLCESAGWKAEKRANNTVVVPLASGRHIRIDTSGGAARGVVELGGIVDDGSPGARARELLLLTLAHEVRMIRPLLRDRGAGLAPLAEIEAGFSSTPEAEELNHALAALAVATGASADVFDALSDEDLASRYLAIRKPQTWPPV